MPPAPNGAGRPRESVFADEPALADEPSPIRGISRNVFLIGLVSFCNEMATSMLYPVIPIFLATTLGAPYAAIGLIEGTADAVTAGPQRRLRLGGHRFGRKSRWSRSATYCRR